MDKLPECPENWVECPLGDCADCFAGENIEEENDNVRMDNQQHAVVR